MMARKAPSGSVSIASRCGARTAATSSRRAARASRATWALSGIIVSISSSRNGAVPATTVAATTRSGWYWHRASSWGAEPLPPVRCTRSSPRWSSTSARSSACSRKRRPGSRLDAPNPGRSVVTTRSPRSAQGVRSARTDQRHPGVPGTRSTGMPCGVTPVGPGDGAPVAHPHRGVPWLRGSVHRPTIAEREVAPSTDAVSRHPTAVAVPARRGTRTPGPRRPSLLA